MGNGRWALLAACIAAIIGTAQAAPRSAAERLAFKREQPCPATGQRRGSCPGYVIDHVRPLCAGGPDLRSNMQWQTTADGLAKDKLERCECRGRLTPAGQP